MNNLTLFRIHQDHKITLGKLMLGFELFCFTLELPWKNNEKDISCIPPGTYQYEKYQSRKYVRECLAFHGVPDRDYISMHIGNFVNETNGCILVGEHLKTFAVLNSGNALDKLLEEIDDQGSLTIKDMF